jgi:hypothetical protein
LSSVRPLGAEPRTEGKMIARGLLIGAALIAMGLLQVAGNGGRTTAIGAVVLAVAGVGWLVRHQRAGADR